MSTQLSIEELLAESDREATRFVWEGTFADYLRLVIEKPSLARLAHALMYDAISEEAEPPQDDGDPPVYRVFDGEIFGLEKALDRIVQYFAASSQRREVRKRILLLLGPPASGKSSIVDLIKRALECYTRTKAGAVYAIAGCPMQEDPLHLIPPRLRGPLYEQYGIYVEGDLCPRCRYVLRAEHNGRVSEMPVNRVTFSEAEAIGIGYYVATDKKSDVSLLVGSVDTSHLEGDRLEVAGRAFRLDGELNVANRGLVEFVEMFKADRHLLTTLLGLAQERVIKMEKFGSVYADEIIVGHTNEGDFDTFVTEEHSEALRDRIIAFQIPHNLRVREEVKIYQKMESSKLEDIHMAPLTLRTASTFAVLSRLEPPSRQGMSLIDKLRLYDGQMVRPYTKQDLKEIQRHHPNEGMSGISPRYVMNRLDAAASGPGVRCLSPLAALDSLWQGLGESVSLGQEDRAKYISLIAQTVKEYSELAVAEVQRAYEESFEDTAAMLLSSYLAGIDAFCAAQQGRGDSRDGGNGSSERDMREIERAIGINERDKSDFRREINELVATRKKRGRPFDHTTEPRIRAAVEARLFPSRRNLQRDLSPPRFVRHRAERMQRRTYIAKRLIDSYGYCPVCAEDLINYVIEILNNKSVLKTPKNEGIEWLWPLNPDSATPPPVSSQR